MQLWLDDLRSAPAGWTWVTTAWDAIDALRAGGVLQVSLDHDLGPPDAGTGYDVATWIEAEAYHGRLARLRWSIHSANPIGAERMRRALEKADTCWDLTKLGGGCGFAEKLEGDDARTAALADDAAWEDVVRERLGFDPTVCRRCDKGPLVRTPIAASPTLVRRDLERVMAGRRGPP